MSLFDPYSHARILELREERISRAARRRESLGLGAAEFPAIHGAVAASAHALVRRLARQRSARTEPGQARPALDS